MQSGTAWGQDTERGMEGGLKLGLLWARADSPSPSRLPQVSRGISRRTQEPCTCLVQGYVERPPLATSMVLSLARPSAWVPLEVGTRALGVTERDFRAEVRGQDLWRSGCPGQPWMRGTAGETSGAPPGAPPLSYCCL